VIVSWTRFLLRRRWDEERAREIEAHLAHEIEDNIARGLPPAAARAAAYRSSATRRSSARRSIT
jgi:hypothetical protein